jgi:hypothetical protein
MPAAQDLLSGVLFEDERLEGLVRDCLDHLPFAKLLHLLYAHPTTLMTIPDISDRLVIAREETELAIRRLLERGFLRHVSAGGVDFYGLTDDPDISDLVRRFEGWCEDQHSRWSALRGVIQ